MKEVNIVKLKKILFILLNIVAVISLLCFFTLLILSMISNINFIPPFFSFCLSIILAYLMYTVLMPLHELGHYYIAKLYKKDVSFYLYWSHTYCSNWDVFVEEQAIFILAGGVIFKGIYCLISAILCFILKQNILLFTFINTFFFELIFNMSSLPNIFKINKKDKIENDFYQMQHRESFINDKKENDDYSDCRNNFICKIYPLLLLIGSVILYILTSIFSF